MKQIVYGIFLFLFSGLSLAMPSLSNRCGEKGISFVPPENATLVAFNEDCDTAFIGPPDRGNVTVDQVMGSMNLLFCNTVKTLPKTVEASRAGMNFWADRLAQKSQEYDVVAKEVTDYKRKLADLKPLLESKKKMLEKREAELSEARTKMGELRGALDDCKSSSTDTTACADAETELKQAFEIVKTKRDVASDANLEVIDLERQVQREEGSLKEINDRIEALTFDLTKYKSLLKILENDALEGYQRYGQLYGATANINFHADWSALIRHARTKNPNSSLHIAQMPLVGTKVAISAAMPQGFNITTMSTLIGARVPGFDIYSSQGEPKKMDLGHELSLNPVPWGTTMSGQLDFNLIGACTMVDAEDRVSLHKAREVIGAGLVINLQHTYPIMMKRDYEITYNAQRIVNEMEKLTESGGFLSSSKIHELTKNSFSSDKFTIKFYDQGGQTTYSDEEKKQITDDAKYEIVDRILRDMNAIPQYSEDRPPMPRLDRSSGARFIYANLPCFGYPVCYAAGFIIGVVDAIFGSKEAVSNFTQINDTTVSHRYIARSPGYGAVNTTFSRKG